MSTSTSTLPVRLTVISGATLLILASAALGAYFGFQIGSHYHLFLGIIFALAALGGEALKPFAVAASLDALKRWDILRGMALGTLAIVCVIYSIASELSLAAGTRGDLAAVRTQQAETLRMARDTYASAKGELAMLPVTRSVGELNAKISALMLTPGAEDCSKINGPVTRRVCPEVAKLRTELGRAVRRSELERSLIEAKRTMAKAPAATEPDPLASALAVYLAALGWNVQAVTLAPFLYLIPVLFLELGSTLGVVLVRSVIPSEAAAHVEQTSERRTVVGPSERRDEAHSGTLVPTPTTNGKKSQENKVSQGVPSTVPSIPAKDENDDDSSPGGRLGTRLLGHLQQQGGTINSGQRGLAKLLGTSKTELNRTLHRLSTAGAVTVDTSRQGTVVALAATC